jgi:hypothetical protein
MKTGRKRTFLLNGLTQFQSAGILSVFSGLAFAVPHSAGALTLYDGSVHGNDLEIQLTTTLSWTPIWRTQNPSAVILASPNNNDADLANPHGLVSNLFEVLPVLDIKDGGMGAHFSLEGYLNSTYLGTNANSPANAGVLNYTVPKVNDYTSATRNVNGQNIRLLDAFVYDSAHFGADDGQTVSMRVGRETLLWGQSLYLTTNGIAGMMAPVDVQTAENNPNAQTQQIIEPIGQVELTYQPNQILTFQGYYKFQWQPDFFPGAGSYFNSSDVISPGSQRLVAIPDIVYLKRLNDLQPTGTDGQFGVSTQLSLGNHDVGFYALRADSYTPVVAVAPPANYLLVYPRDIWVEGASDSTTVGAANVGAEVSFRQHMNLAQGTVIQLPTNNANSNPAYPTGNTWAAQASVIYVTPGIPLDPGGISISGEAGFNHVLATTANKQATAGYGSEYRRTSTAGDLVVVVTPTYYNVVPNLQLTFPIGFHYNVFGRSEIDSTENKGTGSINFGVAGTYRVNWTASLTFNDYLGAPNPALSGEPSTADRNYILANLQYSF